MELAHYATTTLVIASLATMDRPFVSIQAPPHTIEVAKQAAPVRIVDAAEVMVDGVQHVQCTVVSNGGADIARIQIAIIGSGASGAPLFTQLYDVPTEELPNNGRSRQSDVTLSMAVNDGDHLTVKVTLVETAVDVWAEESASPQIEATAPSAPGGPTADVDIVDGADAPAVIQGVQLIRNSSGVPSAVRFTIRNQSESPLGETAVEALMFDGRSVLRKRSANTEFRGIPALGVRVGEILLFDINGRSDWQVVIGMRKVVQAGHTWENVHIRSDAEALVRLKKP